MIALRHSEPVVAEGDFRRFLDDDSIYAQSLDGHPAGARKLLRRGRRRKGARRGVRAGSELVLGNYAAPDEAGTSITPAPGRHAFTAAS